MYVCTYVGSKDFKNSTRYKLLTATVHHAVLPVAQSQRRIRRQVSELNLLTVTLVVHLEEHLHRGDTLKLRQLASILTNATGHMSSDRVISEDDYRSVPFHDHTFPTALLYSPYRTYRDQHACKSNCTQGHKESDSDTKWSHPCHVTPFCNRRANSPSPL